jgi:hypothetical protein
MLLFSSTLFTPIWQSFAPGGKGRGNELHPQRGLELGAETLNDLLRIKGAKMMGLEDRASDGHNFASRSAFTFAREDVRRDALFCVELTLPCQTFREGGVRRQYPPYFLQRVTWSEQKFFSRPSLHLCPINDLELFYEMTKQESALVISLYVYMTCNTLSRKYCLLLAEFEATFRLTIRITFRTLCRVIIHQRIS